MRRRDFIAALGGAATTWSVEAHAQQVGQMRRVCLLLGIAENDPKLNAAHQGKCNWRMPFVDI